MQNQDQAGEDKKQGNKNSNKQETKQAKKHFCTRKGCLGSL